MDGRKPHFGMSLWVNRHEYKVSAERLDQGWIWTEMATDVTGTGRAGYRGEGLSFSKPSAEGFGGLHWSLGYGVEWQLCNIQEYVRFKAEEKCNSPDRGQFLGTGYT